MSDILVILHKQERNEYDRNGRLLSEKGTVWVSHGIDITTGRNVMLSGEKWQDFAHHCVNIDGEWYIK